MVASLLLALGCGGSSETIGPPSAIEITAGNNQQSTVGQPLPVTPTARVRDKDGHNLSAITVRFTVVSGGGTIAADTAITDANGVVVLPSWTLGTRSGANTLKVQASGLTTSVTVNATGTAAAPSNLATVDQVNFAALVQTQVTGQPTVLVTDGFGNPVGGVIVTFSVSLNNGSLTGAAPTTDAAGHASLAGWTLGSTVGVNRVTASASGTNSVQFEAQGLSAAPTIVSTSPTTQAGILGAMVPRVPQVRVTNSLGQILGGVPVRFAISGGGDATVLGPLAVSDPITGIAAPTDWRLGPASTSSTVIATLPGFPGSSVTFNATGTFSPFLIDVRFLSSATPAQRDAFASAAARWMQIIVGDIPDVPVSLAVGTCATGASPAMNETIDDVVIFAQVTGIDGVGGILGSAGPCIRRSTGLFTAVGSMRFDMADLVGLQNTNRLEPVILHEMAHVLGFGTIWTEKGVLVGAGGADPVFTGAEALSVWPSFNLGYAGTPVPVENLFGAGTRDSHWRESVLVSELMTGFIEAPGVPTPLSRLTIASFKDLGYSISYSTADAYAGNLMAAMREAGAGARTPINDIVENAQWEVTPLGIVRRIH
ncbi:MAG: leishmanolysin-related zinc metalloendopeptidase [Gemmatimonadota bacterium]